MTPASEKERAHLSVYANRQYHRQMAVSVFDYKPEKCPYGHVLWPGHAQVSWQPCICGPAREAAERNRGMGHVRVQCDTCHDQHRQTVYYEPPHDRGHRPLTGWSTPTLELDLGFVVRLCGRLGRGRPLRPRGRFRRGLGLCFGPYPGLVKVLAHVGVSLGLRLVLGSG